MKYFLGILLVSFLMLGCDDDPLSRGKTIVKVGSQKITEGHLQFLATVNPSIERQLSNPAGRQRVLDSLVEQELFFQAARDAHLLSRSDVQNKIDLYRKVIIAQSYVEDEILKNAQKYFEEHPQEFERVGLAHLMIGFQTPADMEAKKKSKSKEKLRTEKEALQLANQLFERLQKGEKIENLAKEYSDDLLTQEQGGSLGLVSRDDPRLTRRGFGPLLEKAFQMKVGEMAGPIKTASGYHLIVATAPAEKISFDEAKNQIFFRQRGEVRDKLLEDLKTKYLVKYLEEEKKEPQKDTEQKDAEHVHEETPETQK